MSRKTTARVDLLPAQRHALILDVLRDFGAASVQDLADRLDASVSTVRRDLDYLTEQGYLDRTHGGAVIRSVPSARFEPEASISAELAKSQKSLIGAEAARRVKANQSILFDASSTVQAVSHCLFSAQIPITAVTNDLITAGILSKSSKIETIVTGGVVRSGTGTLIGAPGDPFLTTIHVDIAFIGVHAISDQAFTETSLALAAMKRRMIEAAAQVIVLADSSKFGLTSFCDICTLADVDEVITDSGASAGQIDAVRAAGTTCTVVDAVTGQVR
ncbi:DeoR/GlpR family DNA-binding transcription regulator [Roseinatronobacter sp. NSM]|uniref:DeoR/GlpR family DNA-binding transcription regulator n=1 Tax=Roseinatronobacter sp. NSM TaxID=3457785 RepID=UPI0040366423